MRYRIVAKTKAGRRIEVGYSFTKERANLRCREWHFIWNGSTRGHRAIEYRRWLNAKLFDTNAPPDEIVGWKVEPSPAPATGKEV